MPEFTQFELDNPVVIPATSATEEKVFNKQWLVRFTVDAPSPDQPTKLLAYFAPYNGTEITEQGMEKVEIENLFGMLVDESLPEAIRSGMVQAIEGVFQALKAYKDYQNNNS